MTQARMNQVRLFLSIVICMAAAGLGSVSTFDQVPTWYLTLHQPSIAPPIWLFGPVWTLLYMMMGLSLYQVWSKPATGKRPAILIFGVQLTLNAAWSYIFFSLHEIGWAFAEIMVLWVFIVLSIIFFSRISRLAAWLLVPYLLWVSFAAVLNFAFWRLNP